MLPPRYRGRLSDTSPSLFASAVAQLLAEAYEGTQGQSWFSGSGPGSGLFATLAGVDAATASRSSAPGGPSIAAHAGHLRWSLAMANVLTRGEQASRNRAESWSVGEVSSDQWAEIQADLRREYETLRQSLPPQPGLSNPVFVTSGVALVARAAYHLGAVRHLALSPNIS